MKKFFGIAMYPVGANDTLTDGKWTNNYVGSDLQDETLDAHHSKSIQGTYTANWEDGGPHTARLVIKTNDKVGGFNLSWFETINEEEKETFSGFGIIHNNTLWASYTASF